MCELDCCDVYALRALRVMPGGGLAGRLAAVARLVVVAAETPLVSPQSRESAEVLAGLIGELAALARRDGLPGADGLWAVARQMRETLDDEPDRAGWSASDLMLVAAALLACAEGVAGSGPTGVAPTRRGFAASTSPASGGGAA